MNRYFCGIHDYTTSLESLWSEHIEIKHHIEEDHFRDNAKSPSEPKDNTFLLQGIGMLILVFIGWLLIVGLILHFR